MSTIVNTAAAQRSATTIVALIGGSASARYRRIPADLRTAVSANEIREADNRYRIEVTSTRDRAFAAAWERFESGVIDNDEYRRLVRLAQAELERRLP